MILHTCRSVLRDRDAAMDAYAFVLEALRQEDYKRLRAYVPDGKTRFATWLLVVSRRLVLDHVRHRYGRGRSAKQTRRADQETRKRLEDLLAAEIEPDQLPSEPVGAPDAAIRRSELTVALRRAVAELSVEDRLLLTLRFLDERSVRDIAATLRLPSVFHVYRRLGGALSTLRELLRRRGVDDAQP